VVRDPVVGRVVVAIHASGDELDTPSPREAGTGGVLSGRNGNRQRLAARMHQPWLAERVVELVVSRGVY
jgi:hypothetical protein